MKSAAGLIRIASLIITAVIVASFALFVWDELDTASNNQLQIAAANGTQTAIVRDQHGRLIKPDAKVRVKIDEFNDTLTSPGEEIGKKVGGGNEWTMRGLAFIFGMLVFLVGLRLLAEFIEKSGNAAPPVQQRDPRANYTAGYR